MLGHEELRPLLESAETTGTIRRLELTELLEPHELAPLEVDALERELEARGFELVDEPEEKKEPAPASRAAVAQPLESTTDALQLFLREAGRHPLLTAAQEVSLAKRIERGDGAGQAADDPVEPAPRRLDREELPEPGPAVPRPDPGGHARADPRRREVRLAPRLQVLDLRDLVDPPGRRAGARGQGADDPHAGPHRRAAAEDEPRRADALDGARPRADARGDRRGGEPPGAAGEGGASRRARVDEPRPARRRGGGRDVRRLRRRRLAAPGGRGRDHAAQPGARRGARRAHRARPVRARPALRARRCRAEDARGDRQAARADARARPPDRDGVAQAPRAAARDGSRRATSWSAGHVSASADT